MISSPKLSITHVQGLFSPEHGGPTFSLANYCRGQISLGHQVSLRVLEGYPHTSPALRLEPPVDMGVDCVGWPSRLGVSGAMRKRLQADPTPDVYHLHGAWLRAMHYGAVEARRRQRPYVVELMGMYEEYPLRQKWLVKRLSRVWFQDSLLRQASCLHVNSANEARALRELGFRTPIAVIPVGVDTAEVRPRDIDNGRCPYPDLETRPFILYLARVHAKKGIELLLQAWAVVADQFADHCLVVAGSGEREYVARCKEITEKLCLTGRCRWLGAVDALEKKWLFRHAEVYVLPSFSENFGNTVAEALAHGTPVLTTSQTPWADLPTEGCGWIAEPAVESLCAALPAALATTSERRRQMGENGRRMVDEKYSLTSVVRQINRVYEWLLGRSRPDDLLHD